MAAAPLRIVILVATKGRGSNMQTIIDGCASGSIPAHVVGVISPSENSPALQRAAAQQIPTAVMPYNPDNIPASQEEMYAAIKRLAPGLIVLAGFLRKLGDRVVSEYSGRIMNIHPALIPSFCGQGMYGHHVHQAVIDSGVKYSGCTVHFVDDNYDTGPIIDQAVVAVEPDDDAESLAARVLKEEHRLFPQCVKLFAEGRLKLDGRKVRILPNS